MTVRLVIATLAVLVSALPARSHEVRPGFLEITTRDDGRYEVLWKTPMRGGAILKIRPDFPLSCTEFAPARRERVPGALVERRALDCGQTGLAGRTVTIDGLSATQTDVVVRLEHADGTTQSLILKPQQPSFTVTGAPAWTVVAADYLRFGVEHILLGIDHLLFVLGLMLIVRGVMPLVKTITAFTIAHSVTLAAAVLGFVHVPQAPVEAVIALSILFLASELLRREQGNAGLTERYPWVVAFIFGLLHGFGFAGALTEVGLPQSDIPLALLTFNVGVELGQLLFVGAALLSMRLVSMTGLPSLPWVRRVPAQLIGIVAAFWFIERTYGMLG